MLNIFIFYLLFGALILLLFHHTSIAAIFLFLSILFYWLVGSGLLATPLLAFLQSNPTLQHPVWQKNNAILLLGSGTVRTFAANEVQPSILAYGRILEAYKLYRACVEAEQHCTIVISGADVLHTGETEAEAYQKVLLALGMPAENCLLDTKSHNTFENAQFIHSLIEKEAINQTILVTSGFHVKRAAIYFQHFGMQVILAPADTLRSRFSWLPLGYNFMITGIAIHEYIDIAQYYLYRILKIN